MGIFDDADDSAGISGLPTYKAGTYFVLITDVSERNDEWKILKISGVVLHVESDLGDSNGVGDEVEASIFKKKKDKFFESDTRKWFKAGKNISSKDEVNAVPMATIGDFLLGKKIVGRVFEVKVSTYEKKEGGLGYSPNPVRALTPEEVYQTVPAKIMARYAPERGIKDPATGKSRAVEVKAKKAAKAPVAETEEE